MSRKPTHAVCRASTASAAAPASPSRDARASTLSKPSARLAATRLPTTPLKSATTSRSWLRASRRFLRKRTPICIHVAIAKSNTLNYIGWHHHIHCSMLIRPKNNFLMHATGWTLEHAALAPRPRQRTHHTVLLGPLACPLKPTVLLLHFSACGPSVDSQFS
ncbi:hypothetical protein K461DRAFT_73358 [Myriangium duriaei CBS 260.36]|uniref:Uncharacterized protein n=1 Tax=Myriangium duriaei CBS 260.36 TaxID=1168546 RepID=A0A9P4ISH7_9PEZI|nr:hypothetical protein K461DRAFT_73358 [Myriangium duriaei CBS 260.36]